MDNLFHKQFKGEFLLREKLRTSILAKIFFAGSILASLNFFLFGNNNSEAFNHKALLYVMISLFSPVLFELSYLLYINRHIKKNLQAIPAMGQYLNAFIEISSPAIIMFLLSGQFHNPARILQLPISYTYFIFIILSTLRLNFRLSFFTGFVAAIEFFMLSIHLTHKSNVMEPGLPVVEDYLIAAAKSLALLLSGIGAAFVAGQIRKSINRSLQAIERESKIVNLFGQQISKEIVDEMIKNNGTVQSKMMRVSTMFIDIRNFTNHVADQSPAEIVKYQNAFFSIVVNAVTKYKGIVNQFLGDGCMVTFGAPVTVENSGENAVQAALEIQRQLNKEIKLGNIPPTNIGVGIHIGDAVTGNIGTTERQQYSITSSVVILAARIEQLNKEYNSQILVSENVMESIHNTTASRAEFISKADLKGWNKPVGIYKIV